MRLLISVADPSEVTAALRGGADLIDVKNPAAGALGAASPAVLRAVRHRVVPPVEVSAALGDTPDDPALIALAAHGAVLCGAEYVKVGMRGCRDPDSVLRVLAAVRDGAVQADPRARVVAVAYTDAARAGALPPELLPALAREAEIHGVMLDTCLKDGTSTFGAMGEERVAEFVAAARREGLSVGIAGSLGAADFPRVRRIAPDVVGVRGAACDGGRLGAVSAHRVRELRGALGLDPLHPGTEQPPRRALARWIGPQPGSECPAPVDPPSPRPSPPASRGRRGTGTSTNAASASQRRAAAQPTTRPLTP